MNYCHACGDPWSRHRNIRCPAIRAVRQLAGLASTALIMAAARWLRLW